MKNYKLVIFDMDGTLADTSEGILNSIRYTQKKMQLPEITLEQMYSHVGPTMEESYSKNFGLSGEKLKQAVSFHKEYALIKGYKELHYYVGIEELLILLRKNKIKTAVASLKANVTLLKILDETDMSKYFDVIIGSSEELNKKVKLLDYCVNKSGIDKSDTVLIGDSSYDAIGANEFGIDFIAVTYGFGFINNEEAEKYVNIGIFNDVKSITDLFAENSI